jgi:hypothetical protein
MPPECKGLTKNDFPATSLPGTTSTSTGIASRTDESAEVAVKCKSELTNTFNAFVQDADDGESYI